MGDVTHHGLPIILPNTIQSFLPFLNASNRIDLADGVGGTSAKGALFLPVPHPIKDPPCAVLIASSALSTACAPVS